MSMEEDYRPCHHCGELTDSGVCSSYCADALDEERRMALEQERADKGLCTNCGDRPCPTCTRCHDCEDVDDCQGDPGAEGSDDEAERDGRGCTGPAGPAEG